MSAASNPARLLAPLIWLCLIGCGSEGSKGKDSDAGAGSGTVAGPGEPPLIPVGLDAYRLWPQLPNIRIGQRAYMRSTYDRAGWNEAADASHFLRQEADDFNVTLDVAGPGVLVFARTNHWHGSPWHYVVDGTEQIVEESSTATPNAPVANSVFIPEELFPSPLTATWSTTNGADLNWVPMPFERSFTLAYSRTHYGTGYYIYQLFDPSAENLSTPLETWDATAPPQDVLDLLASAGTDITNAASGLDLLEGTTDVAAADTTLLAELTGPSTIQSLRLRLTKDQALALSRATLRVTWDERTVPSIEAPVALFFGSGSLYNRSNAEHLVKALLKSIKFDATDVELSSYFPMPFFESARLEIVGGAEALTGLNWQIRSEPYTGPTNAVGYFHASYVDHTPVDGQDLIVLDTTQVEGGGSFCGSFVGMSWIFSDNAVLTTLEGDPRFFFDDSQSPQAYGTGTEEWGGGGDYWGGQNMTLALAGHPVGAASAETAQNDEDKIESAYRFLLADLMPFGRNARIQLEHGGGNDSNEHYQSVAYWYGLPGECLTLTDEFHVGDTLDELEHAYSSPTASAALSLSSRYELGGTAPESTDTGRHMTDTSEFTIKLDPNNRGALLRRKLDYGFPDQSAEVFVADDRDDAEFQLAGTWYLAGSNRCVYSNPPGELDPPAYTIQTSDRRFREDEFLLPRSLTMGKSRVRVRIHFTPRDQPISAFDPLPEQAFSELRYWVYSYVMPPLPVNLGP